MSDENEFENGEFVVDFTDIADLQPLEEGWYTAEITNSVGGKAQSNYPKITLTWQVVDGPHSGRTIYDTLAFHPDALPFTKKKLVALGFDRTFKGAIEPEGLLGIERQLYVVVKASTNVDPETGEPYPPRNNITKIRDL